MNVTCSVIGKPRVRLLWPLVAPGVEHYREKSPHHTPPEEELLQWLESPEGDELFVFTADARYAGFVTFRVQRLDDEVWGTIAMIYVQPEFQGGDVLPQVVQALEVELRSRGATVMNYMTKRPGFRRLAPRLGFQPRIIEWMKEL